MLWFFLWTLLVLGTLVGAYFLWLRLYRSGRSLLAEAGRATEVLGELADRLSELEATAPEHPLRPVALSDRQAAVRHWDEVGTVRASRRARRRLRYQTTYETWRSFSR